MWLSGYHAISACLEHKPNLIKELYLMRDKPRTEALVKLASKHGISVIWQKDSKLRDGRVLVQGMGAECRNIEYSDEGDFESLLGQDGIVLILDNIQDPHNLGACLRTADAVGADCIIIPKDKSAPITDTVAKVSSGAFATISIVRVTNLARALDKLKALGVWLYGTAGDAGVSLYETDFSRGRVGIVMGSEGEGMRRLTREACDALISIPMQGHVESLNVSVAASICLYEVRRQKQGSA